jgi:hypothetical protein
MSHHSINRRAIGRQHIPRGLNDRPFNQLALNKGGIAPERI